MFNFLVKRKNLKMPSLLIEHLELKMLSKTLISKVNQLKAQTISLQQLIAWSSCSQVKYNASHGLKLIVKKSFLINVVHLRNLLPQLGLTESIS